VIARVARALAAAYPEAALVDDRELVFTVGAARVRVVVQARDAEPALARLPSVSLHYRIEGALAGAEDLARALVRQLVREASRFEAEAPLIDRAAVDQIVEAYRALILAGRTSGGDGPAPCLSLDLRPLPPRRMVAAPAPLVEPCDGCGVAAYCPANEAPSREPRPVRPLVHHDPLAAALAGVRAIADAWQAPPPRAVEDLLLELTQARVGAASLPAPPFELSLKLEGQRVLPRLRIVEYSATGAWREGRGRARGEMLASLAARFAPREAVREWLALIEARQPPGVELSFGLDAALDGSDARPQLYAHVDPRDREAMTSLGRAVIEWSGASVPGLESLLALKESRPVELVLAAHAPMPREPRRTKLYFAVPLALAHDASGLAPAALGSLAPLAPAWGLAVLECASDGARWRKHDFPQAIHFQRLDALLDPLLAPLDAAERERARGILSSRRFAAWPTWLSVAPDSFAIYFVAR
jgi:hypothetical protein